MNTFFMNIIKPLFDKVLPLLEQRFPAYFRKHPGRSRRMEIQMEFPWSSKRWIFRILRLRSAS